MANGGPHGTHQTQHLRTPQLPPRCRQPFGSKTLLTAGSDVGTGIHRGAAHGVLAKQGGGDGDRSCSARPCRSGMGSQIASELLTSRTVCGTPGADGPEGLSCACAHIPAMATSNAAGTRTNDANATTRQRPPHVVATLVRDHRMIALRFTSPAAQHRHNFECNHHVRAVKPFLFFSLLYEWPRTRSRLRAKPGLA